MLIPKKATLLWAEGSKGRVHLGLGSGDMDVGKGAFSSKDMSVLFLALKTVSLAHLAIVTSIEHDWL